ncbi:head-tail connector protein [Sediminispirochaeta smaragdinae]|uniref:Phage gp6-like head-tail connector protein n=1 Tax=Sediminispirochaeta smaragdinae (strain DSM 11293 / JCM 15392 / SEBR 4228) TaxID=573413 RepID=E1R1H2_SEDSS|nr:hypothetical protein [Sediminispirochaeta smaragdinae]ADK81113.1 hypothetical protein Spirs_1991 [Sediminispirochaeta smaragdinae DSM 11293]
MSGELTSWQAVKARLDLEDNQEDKATGLIAVASRRAERYTGRLLAGRDGTLVMDGRASDHLVLPQYPINRIESVKVDPYRVFDGEPVTDYFADLGAGILIRTAPHLWPLGVKNIQVTGNFGYGAIPEDLEESVIQLVGYWLGSQGISWLGKGDAASGEYQTMYVGVMDLPFQVRNVWDSYREVSV